MYKITWTRFIIIFTLTLAFLFGNGITAHASSFGEINSTNEYINLRHNYYLDIEKVGVLDSFYKFVNGMANGLFSIIKFIVYWVISSFLFVMTFDLAGLFSEQIKSILTILNDGVFMPLLYLGIAFSFFTIVKRLFQQNVVGIMMELTKVIIIIALSIALVQKADVALRFVTNTTRNISLSAMNGLNLVESGDNREIHDYAADTADMMWDNMLHKPWLSLQFGDGNEIHEDIAEKLLRTAPGSSERAKIIKDNESLFPKGLGMARFGVLFIMWPVTMLKSMLLMFISLILIVFQVIAMLLLFVAPLVLILAFFPSYQTIINTWFMKFLETQVTIFVITLVLGMIIRIDSLIFGFSHILGWLGVMIFQLGIIAVIIWQREKVISLLSNLGKSVQNPHYLNSKMRNFDTVQATRKVAVGTAEAIGKASVATGKTVMEAGRVMGSAVKGTTNNIKAGTHYLADKHNERVNRGVANHFSKMEGVHNFTGHHDFEGIYNYEEQSGFQQTNLDQTPNRETSFTQYKNAHTVEGNYVPLPQRPNLTQRVNQRREDVVTQKTEADSNKRIKLHISDPEASMASARSIASAGTRIYENRVNSVDLKTSINDEKRTNIPGVRTVSPDTQEATNSPQIASVHRPVMNKPNSVPEGLNEAKSASVSMRGGNPVPKPNSGGVRLNDLQKETHIPVKTGSLINMDSTGKKINNTGASPTLMKSIEEANINETKIDTPKVNEAVAEKHISAEHPAAVV